MTVYCAAGYRSMIAASWLAAAGVSDLLGGYAAWVQMQVLDAVPTLPR